MPEEAPRRCSTALPTGSFHFQRDQLPTAAELSLQRGWLTPSQSHRLSVKLRCGVQRKLDVVSHSGAPSRNFATTSAQDSRFPPELARLRALAISASVGGRRTSPMVRPLASTSSIGPSLARIFAARSSATATFVMRQSSF